MNFDAINNKFSEKKNVKQLQMKLIRKKKYKKL